MRLSILLILLLIEASFIFAQPIADFSLPATACLNQSIALNDLSQNATQYFWDFNHGDLSLLPAAKNIAGIGGNITTGIDVVFDGINWYGFVTSRSSDAIIRLDYGSDLNNTPSISVLSNVLGSIAPTDIKLIFADNEWFGFVYGANTSYRLKRIYSDTLT